MPLIPNYLSPIEFQVSIMRLPHVQFFTQQTSIPNVSTTPIRVPSRLNPFYQTPDEVDFSNLDLTFIVDEEMNNYTEIFDWMIGAAFPEKHSQYKDIKESEDGLFSDISVLILNSKKNANINITYKNCFPISLSDISLNTTDSDITYPQVTATFQYDTFDIEKLTT